MVSHGATGIDIRIHSPFVEMLIEIIWIMSFFFAFKQVIAITVEDEEDIGKFKDYTPSSTADAAPTKAEPTPAPPKEEKVKQPSSPPEPKASKPSTPPTGDRVFASPLARKLAEDNNVSFTVF